MTKRALIALLALGVILNFLVSCSNGGDDDPGAPDSGVTGELSVTPTAPVQTPAPGFPDTNLPDLCCPDNLLCESYNPLTYGMEPFGSPVTIRIPVLAPGGRRRYDDPDIADNHYTRWINRHFGQNLNVTVEYVPITGANLIGVYGDQRIIKNRLTVYLGYDWPIVRHLAYTGVLQPFDIAEFAQTAPTWYEHVGGQAQLDMFKLGSLHYFAPALRQYWDTDLTYVTFYRKDWHREAGIELFTTWDEYVQTLERFKELGINDGLPVLYETAYLWGRDRITYNITAEYNWPRDELDWVMYSDFSIPPFPSISVYNALKKNNILYSKGLIPPDFEYYGDLGDYYYQNFFLSGVSYSCNMAIGPEMPLLEAFYNYNPDAELGIIYNNTVFDPWTDSFGYRTVPQMRAGSPVGLFVGFGNYATPDELRAAWMYMEWMAQEPVLEYMQWGLEGVTYTVNEGGMREMMSREEQGDMLMGFANNRDYWGIVEEVRMHGTIEETIAALAPKNLPQDFTQELIDNYYYLQAAADAGLIYSDMYIFADITSHMVFNHNHTIYYEEYYYDYAQLNALFHWYSMLLTKADPKDFDRLYAEYVQEYLDAGYQEVIDGRLTAFEAGLTTRLPDIPAGRAPFAPYDPAEVVPRLYTILD